jgi:hypothetical protein
MVKSLGKRGFETGLSLSVKLFVLGAGRCYWQKGIYLSFFNLFVGDVFVC